MPLAGVVISGGSYVDAWLAAAQGVLTCAPNSKNPRDLDIDIAFSFRGASGDMDWTQTFRLR